MKAWQARKRACMLVLLLEVICAHAQTFFHGRRASNTHEQSPTLAKPVPAVVLPTPQAAQLALGASAVPRAAQVPTPHGWQSAPPKPATHTVWTEGAGRVRR